MSQLSLIASILFSLILGANAFRYKDAENWGKQYPECNGKHQSPVIINDNRVPFINQTLRLTDLDKLPTKLTVKNTGHTVEIKADWSGEPPRITGGPLHGNYVFEKTTFHWAEKRWAEQVVSGEVPPADYFKYDVDLHMFFYRKDLKSFEKAQTQKGGLAVLKTGLKSGYEDPEHLFDNLENNLHKVQCINSSAEISPFPLASIFNHEEQIFLSYEGSLDYPPCSESVTWLICNSSGAVTDGLVNGIRKIKLAGGDVSNVRPVQPLNKRQFKMVYNQKGHEYVDGNR